MKNIYRLIFSILFVLFLASCGNVQKQAKWELRTIDGLPERTVAIDTMELRDPFIILDKK